MFPTKKTFQNNISYTACNEVAAICKPLQDHLGIDYFNFQYEFVNWETNQIENVILNNSHNFLDIFHAYYTKKGTYKVDIKTTLDKYQKHHGQYLLDSPATANFAHNVYGMHNTLRKLEKINDNEWLRIVFATKSSDTSYLNLYLNNQDLLDKFILYFKDQAKLLIKKATANKCIFDEIALQTTTTTEVNVIGETRLVTNPNHLDFLNAIESRHNRILNKNGDVIKIPRGEMLCLQLIAHGRTAKEIANILGISPRTVETNFNKSKQRLNCFSRKELLDLLEKNKIISNSI